ncbi:hypothetical protein BGZ89_007119, partial [Linnemannia elongata]
MLSSPTAELQSMTSEMSMVENWQRQGALEAMANSLQQQHQQQGHLQRAAAALSHNHNNNNNSKVNITTNGHHLQNNNNLQQQQQSVTGLFGNQNNNINSQSNRVSKRKFPSNTPENVYANTKAPFNYTEGIVGYGHIGSQLSVLAESMGMRVLFYDVVPLMPLGTSKQVNTLSDLLTEADFVTLHVPETEDTKNMIGENELNQMKQGSFLINASRGTIVQIPALAKALRSGHLGGAAVDVFPKEPAANGKFFESEL